MNCIHLRYWSALIWYWSMTSSTGGSPGWGANPCLGFMSPSHTESGAPLLKAPALFTQCPTRRMSLKKGDLVLPWSSSSWWRKQSLRLWVRVGLVSSPGFHGVADQRSASSDIGLAWPLKHVSLLPLYDIVFSPPCCRWPPWQSPCIRGGWKATTGVSIPSVL